MKITKIVFIIYTLLSFFTSLCLAQNIKKANKLLIKGEFDKFQETLKKTTEKDSLNPGIDFLYARLYLLNTYPEKNLYQAKNLMIFIIIQ